MMKQFYFLFLILGLLSLWACEHTDTRESYTGFHNDKPENPREREEWRAKMRGGFVDPKVKMQALKQLNKLLEKQNAQPLTKDAGLNAWTEKGPYGIGGRIRGFAVDPNDNNHLFVGSVGGGIWETTDAGVTWNQLNDFLPALPVSSIVYDPHDSNVLYAATGEGVGGGWAVTGAGGAQPGLGIYKSSDNGASWQLLNSPTAQNFFWVNDVVVDPSNANWIYAVTTNQASGNTASTNSGRAFRSQDGGSTWQQIASLNSPGLEIKINPFDSDEILIGCSQGLYRSTNATSTNSSFTRIVGGTNQIPDSLFRITVTYCPNDNDRVYALMSEHNKIYRSEDGGATWAERASLNLDGSKWWTCTLWVDPSNSSRLIAGGVELFRSTSGGMVFTRITDTNDDIGKSTGGNNSIHADHHKIIRYNNYNGSGQSGVYIANDGGLYSTNDIWSVTENNGWISNNGDIAIVECYGGHISSDGTTLIVGTQDNCFNLSTDNGSTWTQPQGGDGGYAWVNPDDKNIMYANTNYNSIHKSIDGGTNWNLIARFGGPGLPACASDPLGCVQNDKFLVDDNTTLISYFTIDPNGADILFSCGERLWRNHNAGDPDDWSMIKDVVSNTPRISALEIDDNTSLRIWVGYDNGILHRTTSAGLSWSGDLKNASMPDRYITDIAINPNNSDEVIVAFGGYTTDNLYYSSNALAATPTWSSITTGIPIQVNSVVWHPTNSDWIYVGTDLGILASEDKGQNWSVTPLYSSVSQEGPINAEVSQLFWQPGTTNLCAVTHGRGFWKSNEIKDKIYIDKDRNCAAPTIACNGSYDQPYNNLEDALHAGGHGSEIIFLSENMHEEIPSGQSILIEKRLNFSLDNNGESVIIED